MAQVIKFPGGPKPVPYWCGKPMKTAKPTPKRGQSKLVDDVAEIYSAIPADLGRGQAAYIYVSTVLQFSRQIMRDLSADDLEMLSALVESAGDVRAGPDWDEVDILVDMVNSEYARRDGGAA
ncbi:hypothetical protein [Neorhizobium galegae]|uniref:hypothetical protein n=1 Tax=Neorhizobium galegae TaxID=399 RepID=UPI00062181D6|nr:hypothetical protein [Neorhizobium galegae]CDZ50400.1 Hypothetical protein NGAL_HAMBI2427_36180 [Neorhizobium galegae bv. orientalis]